MIRLVAALLALAATLGMLILFGILRLPWQVPGAVGWVLAAGAVAAFVGLLWLGSPVIIRTTRVEKSDD